MTTLLHIDSSARRGLSGLDSHGSHTRRLTALFVEKWQQLNPSTKIIYRDVGTHPPSPVTGEWIHAAFTPEQARKPWMQDVLAHSDELVNELLQADLIVAGVPMYNFGPPAQFKAYIDNIVRVGKTFGFDRAREGEPYWPLLTDQGKQLVILSSRGDYGYNPGERIAASNHVESSVRTAFAYIGITRVESIAIEYDEFADHRLMHSIEKAEAEVKRLVRKLAGTRTFTCDCCEPVAGTSA
jgi:FMN-dependent NADH-azoreductase